MSREDGYGLVMPFVNVASKGGPYDDDAFTAGYRCGLLDGQLQVLTDRASVTPPEPCVSTYVDTASVQQVDLIAMRWGWTTLVGEEVNGWVSVILRPADAQDEVRRG